MEVIQLIFHSYRLSERTQISTYDVLGLSFQQINFNILYLQRFSLIFQCSDVAQCSLTFLITLIYLHSAKQRIWNAYWNYPTEIILISWSFSLTRRLYQLMLMYSFALNRNEIGGARNTLNFDASACSKFPRIHSVQIEHR